MPVLYLRESRMLCQKCLAEWHPRSETSCFTCFAREQGSLTAARKVADRQSGMLPDYVPAHAPAFLGRHTVDLPGCE